MTHTAYKNNEQGFTLLELAIVMLISGLLLMVLMSFYGYRDVYLQHKAERQMERIQFGLAEYFRVFGHYPCPADPADAYKTVNFGMSDFATAGKVIVPPAGGQACTANQGDLPVKSLNFAVGCLTNTVADVTALGVAAPRDQLIFSRLQKGLQSYRTRTAGGNVGGIRLDYCLPDNIGIDIFDNKLTYAVGTTSTRAAIAADNTTYRYNNGTLNLVDQNGNAAAAFGAHYVVISHGADAEGALANNSTNTMFVACGGNAGAVDSNDGENCDGDANFLVSTIADAPGSAIHNDDIVSFSIFGQKIEMEPMSRLQNGATESLSFGVGAQQTWLNIGRVTPSNKNLSKSGLAVGGDVLVGSGILSAQGNLNSVPGASPDINVNNWMRANEFNATRYCYTTSPFTTGGGC